MTAGEPQFLDIGASGSAGARRIAYIHDPGKTPPGVGLFWLSGYKSDMASTKAGELAAFARTRGFGCTRFDYSGHGVSSGRFEDGTIGAWLGEAEAVFRSVTRGPQIVVGSSMGGHIALLLLRRLMAEAPADAKRILGTRAHRAGLGHDGRIDVEGVLAAGTPRSGVRRGSIASPPTTESPTPSRGRLIEDGRNHLLARVPFDPGRPVVILQGALDEAVPDRARARASTLPQGRLNAHDRDPRWRAPIVAASGFGPAFRDNRRNCASAGY